MINIAKRKAEAVVDKVENGENIHDVLDAQNIETTLNTDDRIVIKEEFPENEDNQFATLVSRESEHGTTWEVEAS